MSHNTIIKDVKITEIDCLRTAIAELKQSGISINLSQSGTFRTYEGQPNTCDYTIELPGQRYDVGLVKQPDGSYMPVFDGDMNYGRGVNGSVLACEIEPGEPRDKLAIAKLVQMYGVHVTEKQMALAGHQVVREAGKNGEILLTAEYA
jgi:hypothetical protein